MEHLKSGESVEAALRNVTALASLDAAALHELASVGQFTQFAAGAVLFHEGQQHDQIYFICEGSVKLDMVTAACGRQTILSVGSGELLAWSALIGDRIMSATAIVAEELAAVRFDAAELGKLLEANPSLGFQLMRVVAQSLSKRLLATRLQLLDLYHL